MPETAAALLIAVAPEHTLPQASVTCPFRYVWPPAWPGRVCAGNKRSRQCPRSVAYGAWSPGRRLGEKLSERGGVPPGNPIWGKRKEGLDLKDTDVQSSFPFLHAFSHS